MVILVMQENMELFTLIVNFNALKKSWLSS